MARDLDILAAATQIAYSAQVVGNRHDRMPGYVVDHVFDDQWENTGFYAVGFTNYDRRQVILALRGSQDRLDIVTDGNLGISQYATHRAPLLEYVGQNILGNRVVLAGHSLGGGLAQYLGYDAAREYPAFRRNLRVHTHNGFGGITGITQMYGRFDRKVVAGVIFRNYRHPADLVSRIGHHAGPVYNIAVPPGAPDGLLPAHANLQFLREPPDSAFKGARRVKDESFALRQTLTELGPDLHQALKAILQNGEPMSGIAQLTAVLGAIPAAERREVVALAYELMPFRNVLRRWVGQLFAAPRSQKSAPGPRGE